MKNRRARWWVVLALVLSVSGAAEAEIYKYVTDDGEVIFTTEKRDDLKLIEVIGSPGRPSAARDEPKKRRKKRSSSSSSKPRRSKSASSDKRASQYDALIREAAAAYGLPFAFIKAVMRVESNFNPTVVSHAGAQGLMQLMPATAEELGVTDAFDPKQNIFGGAKYLRMMTNRYDGDINLVLSAYNAGPGNVDKYSGIPFEGTRDYVQKVYHYYQVYQRAEEARASSEEQADP